MKIQDLLKQVYNYLDGIRKPFDKDDRIFLIRRTVDMIEDGLRWTEIKEEIKNNLAWCQDEDELQPLVCPRGDGEPDCAHCPDWNGWTCTYPKD